MAIKYEESFKIEVVRLYETGETVTELSQEFDIAESTIYRWIDTHKTIQAGDELITARTYEQLLKSASHVRHLVEIIRHTKLIDEIPLQRKLELLEQVYRKYPGYTVRELCDALEVSRGTFYNHIFRKVDPSNKEAEKQALKERILDIFEKSGQTFGVKKVHTVLKMEGLKVSNKRVGALMREMGLQSIRVDAKKQYLLGEKRRKENLVQRNFNVKNPNTIWVSDITAFKVKGVWLYLCVIIDLYSRRVIGYNISRNSSTRLLTKTFQTTYVSRGEPTNLTFHSDQGSQYTSGTFAKLLAERKITQSFSQPGTPLDNAVAEAFFANFKKEEAYRREYTSERHFTECVHKYIDFYNNERPHQSLNYRTPASKELKHAK